MTGVESLRGKLLLATPGLVDPNFFRSVVLLLEHNEGGALGVVLNRPTDTAVQEALPTWADLAAEPAVVFTGGPVQPDSAIGLGLASLGDEPDGFAPLLGGVGSVDLAREPDDIRPAPERLRVFAGYSGWGEGQLEGAGQRRLGDRRSSEIPRPLRLVYAVRDRPGRAHRWDTWRRRNRRQSRRS